jgi:multidrug efflux pump subunit AcrA (membrane-fusion protein)
MIQSLKSRTRIVFLAVSVVIVFAVVFFIRKNANEPTERVGKVMREDLVQRVTIAGTTEPLRTTIFAAPYDGYIKKIYVKLGQKVHAGDPIVSITQSIQSSESVFPIRAPFDGTITQVLKNEGQFVKSGDAKEFIARLDDLSKMYIGANSPEIDVLKIKTGFETVIKVSAVLAKNYKGIVREISQAATIKEQWGSRAQVEYLVKIEVTDPDENLMPGMTAVVDVLTNKKSAVLTLAHEFIQKDGDDYSVMMKDGTKRPIKVGLQNEFSFEITEGLSEGDEVLQVDFLKMIEKQSLEKPQ